MVAVVTGGTGFLGSHLCDTLLQNGYEVRCIVRGSSNRQWLEGKNILFYAVGLSDSDLLKEVLTGADYVFHIAGTVRALHSREFYEGNVLTTQVLLDGVLRYAPTVCRVVVVSSLSAAGSGVLGFPLTEAMECRPLTAYGRSKHLQERLCHNYMSVLPISIVRPPPIYGERDTDVFLVFRSCIRGFLPTGRGVQRLSMVYVGDVVRLLLNCALLPVAIGQTYYVSSGNGYTWEEIARSFSRLTGKMPVLVGIPSWVLLFLGRVAGLLAFVRGKPLIFDRDKALEMMQSSWECSIDKARNELGYEPLTFLDSGLVKTYQWYKKQGWL